MAAVITSGLSARTQWLETEHDFGAFDENNGKVTCTMRFVNTGDQPVSIVSARATCGCTMPSYTRRPVAPGDTGRVEIAYNPVGRPGRFSKKVYIETSDDDGRTTLVVKGVVIGASNTVRSRFPVDAGPLKLRTAVAAFGRVDRDKHKSVFVDAYNSSADSIVSEWRNVPPYLKISSGTHSIAAGDYGAFTFFLSGAGMPQYGLVTDSVTLVPDRRNPNDTIDIGIVAIVSENFDHLTDSQREKAPVIGLYPETIDLGIVRRDEGTESRTFEIKNHGNTTMTLRRVYSTDRGITVSCHTDKIKKGKTAKATVTVDLKAIDSPIVNARVQVISNSPDNPTASIRVVGEIK